MQENALSPLYNNDITAEYLRDQNRPHFSDEALATFSPEDLTRANENEAFKQAHPATGIFRVAAEGSQTRDGGVIVKGTLGMNFTLADAVRSRAHESVITPFTPMALRRRSLPVQEKRTVKLRWLAVA